MHDIPFTNSFRIYTYINVPHFKWENTDDREEKKIPELWINYSSRLHHHNTIRFSFYIRYIRAYFTVILNLNWQIYLNSVDVVRACGRIGISKTTPTLSTLTRIDWFVLVCFDCLRCLYAPILSVCKITIQITDRADPQNSKFPSQIVRICSTRHSAKMARGHTRPSMAWTLLGKSTCAYKTERWSDVMHHLYNVSCVYLRMCDRIRVLRLLPGEWFERYWWSMIIRK